MAKKRKAKVRAGTLHRLQKTRRQLQTHWRRCWCPKNWAHAFMSLPSGGHEELLPKKEKYLRLSHHPTVYTASVRIFPGRNPSVSPPWSTTCGILAERCDAEQEDVCWFNTRTELSDAVRRRRVEGALRARWGGAEGAFLSGVVSF